MSSDLELPRTPPRLRLAASINDSSPQTDVSEGCRTPTAAENRIPAMLSCPLAPRKRRREVVACGRKLPFFESVAGEEIEAFFRSSFELVAKRRCRPCT